MIKSNLLRAAVLFALALLLLNSCNKDDDDNTCTDCKELIDIAEGATKNNKFHVALKAVDTLFNGYNPIYLELRDKEQDIVVKQADISLKPLMHMLTKTHATPFENPSSQSDAEGYFAGAIAFVMPSNPDEGWTLDVKIEADGKMDSITLDIPKVKSPEEARMFNFMDGDKKYFVALIEPSAPEVGINDYELGIYTKESMMSFPPVTGLSVEIEPEMPTMDHGSPNNEHPVDIGQGHYKGKVNFTMTGYWKVNMIIKDQDRVIKPDAYFDITFQ